MRKEYRKAIPAAVAVAAVILCGTFSASAEWTKVYEVDWTQGASGWSTGQSFLPGKHSPQRIYVGHPLAEYIIWFDGQDGWGIHSGASIGVPMKIVFRVLMQGSHRNALSLNVRDRGGTLIYKYSMGASNRVAANTQPMPGGGDDAVSTSLAYQLGVPYELTSLYVPGSGFYLSLKNLMTGEERVDPHRWRFKGGGSPSILDFDQEGGRGPAALGKVEVWLDI